MDGDDEARQMIGSLYPTVRLPKNLGGKEKDVIAWLWARTVRCPNPGCGINMPLVNKFWLSTHRGNQAWVNPVVDKGASHVRFAVVTDGGVPPDGTVSRSGAVCIACKSPVPFRLYSQ